MQNTFAVLEQQLKKGQRRFTLNEAAATTGLSIDDSRDALAEIIKKYDCRLQVTENGDLIYDFGDRLHRRGEKTFAEMVQAAADWLWKAFKVLYKIWITVTLVVYFVIFVIILIAIIVGSSSRKNDRSRAAGSFLDFYLIQRVFFSLFNWRTSTGAMRYRTDNLGYRYRQYEPKPSILKQGKKSFIASVYDFVFGPPRAEVDPLNNQKEVAAYLQQQKGVLVTAELNALAGWTFPQAETFLTDCLVRYEGEVKVSENGVMYAEFDQILRGLGEIEGGKIIHYWDEFEPEYEMTGNTSARNFAIAGMNVFNLLFAFFIASGALQLPEQWLLSDSFVQIALGWIPLIFSSLFFLIPIMRWLQIQKLRKQRQINNIRKRVFKTIYNFNGQSKSLESYLENLNKNAQEELLSQEKIEPMLKDLALDLPGDTTVSEDGKILYAFPRITYEMEEITHLRAGKKLEKDLGRVVVDSD